MLKILLWIVSNDGRFFQDAMITLESQHNEINVVGLTVNNEIGFVMNDKDVPFIPQDEVDWEKIDVLLVIGARQFGMSQITQAARQLKLPEEKLLGDWIICIPGFTLEKYRKLQRSRLSIFSKDCFGGIVSHMLGLPFRSPLVNMFFDEQEYIRFLRAPHVYMEERLIFKETKFEPTLKINYPVFTLGNVDLNMNHYPDFDEAETKWYKRKQRINWYNLFVTLSTENEDVLEKFDALPYGKKVCFVPFKSNLDSAWYINPEIKSSEPFWRIVHLFGYGDPFYYDTFDMLLYGKKTQLIDM